MARVHSVPRVRPCAPATPRAGLNRRLRRWLLAELVQLRPAIATSAAACGAERYRKHFDSFQHACLLLFHGLSGSPSLRQSYGAFAACSGLVALSGLSPRHASSLNSSLNSWEDAGEDDRLGVGFSQWAASNTSRPAAFLGGLVPALLARVRQQRPRSVEAVLHQAVALDSTFLRLSFRVASWLPTIQRRTSSGVRLQVQYRPALDLPEHVLVSTVRTSDCQGLDQSLLAQPARLAALRGQTLVLDLGYYSHRRFQALLGAGVHFVTRRHPQASVTVDQHCPVQRRLPELEAGRILVLDDQRIRLGSPNNRAGEHLAGLRLVRALVEPLPKAAARGALPQEYQLLTDRWDVSAHEVVLLYLWRWQIELFLRWLKSHVRLPRLLGTSKNAVQLSVWLAIVVHLLCLLAGHACGLGQRSPTVLARLAWLFAHLSPAALLQAPLLPSQLALPFPKPLGPPPT